MARLRHFAVCVKDLEKAAKFYESVFELERIGREDLDIGSAIYMSDGVINLALLNFTGAAGSKASDLKAPIEEVHISSTLVHLANVSYRLGRTLNFDPVKEEVINDAEANRMLRDGDRGYRKGFEIPKIA